MPILIIHVREGDARMVPQFFATLATSGSPWNGLMTIEVSNSIVTKSGTMVGLIDHAHFTHLFPGQVEYGQVELKMRQAQILYPIHSVVGCGLWHWTKILQRPLVKPLDPVQP